MVPMAELRALATQLGYLNVRTYIQSGNLVFSTDRSARAVSAELRDAIAREIGVDPAVMLRTAREMSSIVKANPFLDRTDQPTQLHVLFAERALDGSAIRLGDEASYAPEEYAVNGREMYFYLPNGLGRSVLGKNLGKRSAGVVGTMRNWRSVLTLRDMAAEAS
jgi:uncharacterized protein (DUF1697 family)